jgi:hypothetical protein
VIIPFPFRILVTGSRDWGDKQELRLALVAAWTPYQESAVIVHGACPSGADAMAAEWARDYGVRAEPHPADWEQFGKSAGFRRNAEMVALGANVCLAFIRNGSRGATHCAAEAQKAGIPVRHYVRADCALEAS